MHRDEVEALWRKSLGPEVDFQGLSTELTYRPTPRLYSRLASALPTSGLPVFISRSGPAEPGRATFEDLAEIGRGGMGIVYRARQVSLDRDVALKQLRPESDPDRALALRDQFLAEAMANGLLDHPNIVPVYDLCVDEQGDLSLSMKLVVGKTWFEVIKADPDNLEKHVEILIQVCNAIAFAHSKNVIHNDLKPSNILIGEYGEVLVMDWGLALDIGPFEPEGRLRHKCDLCGPCGTPGYMAPELARGEGESVGPWSDVYLLGAMLYEMLTGRPPHYTPSFVSSVTRAANGEVPVLDEDWPPELLELLQAALEPDVRERMQDVRSFQEGLRAYLRHKESRQLTAAARDRFDSCKERARRQQQLGDQERAELYEDFAATIAGFTQACSLWEQNRAARLGERLTREAFAALAVERGDLGLAEAQAARLGARGEGLRGDIRTARARLAREQRSRRLLKRSLAALLVCLVAGLGIGLVLAERARAAIATEKARVEEQKALVEQERALAAERGEIAMRTLGQLVTEVQDQLLDELADERAVRVAENILGVARSGYEELRASDLAGADLDASSARRRMRLGMLLLHVYGELEPAGQELSSAVEIFTQVLEQDSLDVARQGLRVALSGLAEVAQRKGELDRARRLFEDILRAVERTALADPGNPAASYNLSVALLDVASVLEQQGKLPAARGPVERAVALGPVLRHGDAASRRQECVALTTLGHLCEELGALDEAAEAYDAQLERSRALLRVDPRNPQLVRLVTSGLRSLGRIRRKTGDPGDALPLFAEALGLDRENAARHPTFPLLRQDLAESLTTYAVALRATGDPAAAREHFREALALREELYAARPDDLNGSGALAGTLRRLGNLELALGLSAAAVARFQRVLEIAELRAGASDTSDVQVRVDLTSAHANLGEALLLRGELADAEQHFDAALTFARSLLAAAGPQARRSILLVADGCGRLWRERRDWTSALALYEECLSMVESDLAVRPDDRRLLLDYATLLRWSAEARSGLGDSTHAAADYDASLDILRALASDGEDEAGQQLQAVLTEAGQLDLHQGDLATASERAAEAIELLLASDPGADPSQLGQLSTAFDLQGRIMKRTGDLETASALFRQAIALDRDMLETDPANRFARRRLLLSSLHLAQTELSLGHGASATRNAASVLDLARSLADPPTVLGRLDLARALELVLHLAILRRDDDPTLPDLAEELLALRNPLVEQGHSDPFALGTTLDVVGRLWLHLGREAAARDCFEAAIAAYQEAYDADPDNLEALRLLAEQHLNLAWPDLKPHPARAIGPITELVALYRELVARDPRFAGTLAQYEALLADLRNRAD